MIGTICIDLFNVQIGVFATDADRLAFLAEKGVEGEEHDQACYASAHLDVAKNGERWFSMVLKDEATYATWAHECVHIADWVMQVYGIPTDASNTEIRAYIVSFLFQKLRDMEPDDEVA